MVVSVCVGSSCHLKGSYDIIKKFEAIIQIRQLENKVKLCGAFCLGKCGEKVTVRIDDDFYFLSPEDDLDALIAEKLDRK